MAPGGPLVPLLGSPGARGPLFGLSWAICKLQTLIGSERARRQTSMMLLFWCLKDLGLLEGAWECSK
eukprot:6253979-Pyramimonas_sp.AAC.1